MTSARLAETLPLTRRQMPEKRVPVITGVMLQDLDATLTALLRAELPVQNVAISFAPPDDQFPPSGVSLPAIDEFAAAGTPDPEDDTLSIKERIEQLIQATMAAVDGVG